MTGQLELLQEVASQVSAEGGPPVAQALLALRHYEHRFFVNQAGELLGTVFNRGPEVHMYVREGARGRAITPRKLDMIFSTMLAEYGYVTTRVRSGSDKIAFVTRMGFTPTWSDGLFDYFILTHSRFGGKDQK